MLQVISTFNVSFVGPKKKSPISVVANPASGKIKLEISLLPSSGKFESAEAAVQTGKFVELKLGVHWKKTVQKKCRSNYHFTQKDI